MADTVDLSAEFEAPAKVSATPTQTTNESVDLMSEYAPPPKPEEHAIINDAADKAHQFKKIAAAASDPNASPETRQQAAKATLGLMFNWFGDHFTSEVKENISKQWETLNTNLVNLPQAPEASPEELAKYPAQPYIAGAYNGAARVASGLTTPLNIGTLGAFGALTKLASSAGAVGTYAKAALTAVKAGFAAQMAKGAGEAAGAASVPEGKTPQEQTASVVEALGQSAMAALAAHSAGSDLLTQGETTNAREITSPAPLGEQSRGPESARPEGSGRVEQGVERTAPAGAPAPQEAQAPQEAPVDIGDRSGRPTGAAEDAIVAEQKRLIDEHLANQAKAEGKPVLADELTPPAAGTEEHAAIAEELAKQSEPSAEPLPTEPPKTVTGIRNAVVDQEREARGLPPAMETAAKEFGTTWDEALKKIDENPNAALDLVNEVRDKPRPLTDTENALLLHRQIDLQNQFERVRDRINEGDENTSPEQKASDQVQLARLSDDLLDIYNVGRLAGTEQGRGLAARKMLAAEDFSLAAMETARRAANDGKPLTKAQSDEVAALHEKIAATQKAFDDYVAANKPRRGTSNTDRNIISTFIAEKANAARERIKARALEGRVSANIDPLDLADHAIVGADYIAKGIENFAEWGNAMVKEFGERIKPHLQAIFDKSKIEAEDALLNARLEARKARLEARIKELNEKVRTGDTSVPEKAVNRPSVEEIEKLEQQRDSLQAELTGMRATEAKINELTEAIAEKEQKIAEGDLSPKPTGVNRPSAPAIEKLKQERDALNKDLAEARKEERKPDDTEIQARKVEELNRRIAEKKAALKSGNVQPKRAELNRPQVQEIEQAKQEIESLNKEIAKNRVKEPVVGGPEKATPEQIRLKSFKTRAENSAKEYQRRLAAGDFGPDEPPTTLKLDAEAERLKAEAYRAKVEFQAALIKDRLANRSSFEKSQDTLVKWRRGFLLSGPGTLIKLTAAAVNRVIQTPIEEGVGAAIGAVAPDVAAKAPRQGGLNTEAEAAALSGAFFRGLQDAAQTLKTGHSDLDVLYGKGAGKNVRESDVLPRSVIDFFGSLHGALKAPVKRAEFERSFEKRMAFAIKEGADVTDPMVQTKIAVDAYKDANRAIFMQDNVVTDAWNAGIARLTKLDKEGNVSGPGKVVATTMRVLLPIVKVPTNIVAETFETATGSVTGSLKLAQAIRNGTENLTPEQADIIMRQLKKGSLGLALLALGYFNPENAGGYYQQGDKRKPGDVKAANIRLFGVDVPSLLIHNPAVEVVQLGATIRRVADSKIKGKEKGLGEGIPSALLGLAEELPFVKTPIELGKLFNPQERTKAEGDLVRGLVVPEAVQSTARFLDKDKKGEPVKRNPKTVIENVKTGIPGLRETVRKK